MRSRGTNRPIHLFRNVVLQHAQEVGRQEKSDGTVSVPPLVYRILDAGPIGVTRRTEDCDRNGQIVHNRKHYNRNDKGKEELVGNANMEFLPA